MEGIDELIPPEEMNFVGAGDFRQIGEEFMRHFVELGGLKPSDKVLDVGCGIGRMAVQLTQYLKDGGSYEGLDVKLEGIKWCSEKITARYPHFRFHLVDVHNKTYNPEGKIRASEFKFPFRDQTFDFAFLTSVFTHMLPEDTEHYLSETSRVLKTGGRCFITYFLLNSQSSHLLEQGRSSLDFRYDMGEYRVVNAEAPEDAICYDEAFVMALYNKYGLRIDPPVRYGSWCGRADSLSYQDIIVGSKRPPMDTLHVNRGCVAYKYLSGVGIEIGALHDPLDVPPQAQVRYVDRMTEDDLRKHYPELELKPLVTASILDDGEKLGTLENDSEDFVIASHFLEHCQDPIGTFTHLMRVLKPGGVLYLAIPDKRFSFDVDRPVTPLEHLIRDNEEGPSWSRRQHFEEWTRLVNRVEDDADAEKQILQNMSIDYSIHYHVWTQAEMIELIMAVKRRLSFEIELILNNDTEVIFVLRKSAR